MKYNPLCALLKNLVTSDILYVGKIPNFFISFGLEELVLDIVKLFLKFWMYKFVVFVLVLFSSLFGSIFPDEYIINELDIMFTPINTPIIISFAGINFLILNI